MVAGVIFPDSCARITQLWEAELPLDNHHQGTEYLLGLTTIGSFDVE